MIPYGRQHVTQADIDTVIRVLQSDFLTQGPKVPLFEQAVADKVGAQYAVAANSGTSALHIACLAMGLGPGIVSGPHPSHLWHQPIVPCIAVPQWILWTSIQTRIPSAPCP